MKKTFSLILTILLLASALVGCASKPQEVQKQKQKIAVATIFDGETWEIQKKYYEDIVGPALNMEFMFSERLSDANGLIDFMDKAYAAGSVGLINYVTSADAVSQGARKANEWKMWFITQNSSLNKEVADLPYNLGHVGAAASGMRTAYEKAFENLLSDGNEHSVFVYTVAAVGGAIGQGAASHYNSAYGILETMQKKYNLNYSKTIDELINLQDPGEVVHDNPNVHIYLSPGYTASSVLPIAQTQFQTGKYDIFATVNYFPVFTNALSDIEKSSGKDIKIIATASIETQTATGFSSKDSLGNSVLNSAVVNPLNNANGICSVMLYNALTGHADAIKENGQALLFKVQPWVVADADTYAKISKLDTSADTYVLNTDDLLTLCIDRNAKVTYKDIEAKLVALGDIDAILTAKIK